MVVAHVHVWEPMAILGRPARSCFKCGVWEQISKKRFKKMFGLFKYPWIGNGPPADHDPIAAGFQHGFDIFRAGDIPVSDDRNTYHFFDFFEP